MPLFNRPRPAAGIALLAALGVRFAIAEDHDDRQIKHVLVIALEKHDWTQPTTVPGGIQPIYGNPNAPFTNSLVNGTADVYIDGRLVKSAGTSPSPAITTTSWLPQAATIRTSTRRSPTTSWAEEGPTSASPTMTIPTKTPHPTPRPRPST